MVTCSVTFGFILKLYMAQQQITRRLAAILAADVAGFSGMNPSLRARDPKKKGGGHRLPRFADVVQAREALACSAIFVNAALSCTARSASTLRSMSIDAFFNPFMNAL